MKYKGLKNMYPVDSLRKAFQYIQRVRGVSMKLLAHVQIQTIVSANKPPSIPQVADAKGFACAL